jgi:hypothetical protein
MSFNLDDFDPANDTDDSTYNDILNNLTTKFQDFINNESNIYNFNNSLKNKLQNILTNLQKLQEKIKLLLFNINDLKQQILDNEAKINSNTKESQDIISKLNDDVLNKNKFINENSIDELKQKYASLENENARLSNENRILNEKVITSESILERFKSQLSDLDINQSASIKNNKDSEDILNQIAQIVDKLNNDIDNHNASGSIPPSSSSENNSFLGNMLSPSSVEETNTSPSKTTPVFPQKKSYLAALNNPNTQKKGGRKTKKNKKYSKKSKKIVNKGKKNTKKSKNLKGGFIVTKTHSSSKKTTNKTPSSSSNRSSSVKPFTNYLTMHSKKQKIKNNKI